MAPYTLLSMAARIVALSALVLYGLLPEKKSLSFTSVFKKKAETCVGGFE